MLEHSYVVKSPFFLWCILFNCCGLGDLRNTKTKLSKTTRAKVQTGTRELETTFAMKNYK